MSKQRNWFSTGFKREAAAPVLDQGTALGRHAGRWRGRVGAASLGAAACRGALRVMPHSKVLTG